MFRRLRNLAVIVGAYLAFVAVGYGLLALQPRITNLTVTMPSGPAALATSCWTTEHTWNNETITDALLNTHLRDNANCLKTEIGNDGLIQRDVMIYSDTAGANNSGSGVTDLSAYSMPANKLATDGDVLRIEGAFACAANGNTKTVALKLGGTAVTASSSACNGTVLMVRATIVRVSSTGERIWGNTVASGLGAQVFAQDGIGENLATTLSLRFTGQGTSSNDIALDWVTITHGRRP